MIQRVLFISLFLWLQDPSFAQRLKVDSLENLLHEHINRDSSRVNLLNLIAHELRQIDPKKSLEYATEAAALSGELNYTSGKAESLRLNGIYHTIRSDFPEALKYFREALLLFDEAGDNHGMSKSYRSLGVISFYQSNYSDAINLYKKALEIELELNNETERANLYNNIGLVYYELGDYEKSLEYCKNALQIFIANGNKEGMSSGYNNIGRILEKQGDHRNALEHYFKALNINVELDKKSEIANIHNNIGTIYDHQGDYSSALSHYEEALEIALEINNQPVISRIYNNIGAIKARNPLQRHEALENFNKALIIREENGDKRGMAIVYNSIGNLHLSENDYIKAEQYFKKGLRLSIEIGLRSHETLNYCSLAEIYFWGNQLQEAYSNSLKAYTIAEEIGEVKLIKRSSELLSKSSAGLGLFENAFNYHVVYKTMSDSVNDSENIKKIVALQYEYEYNKERELAKAEKEKREGILHAELKRQKSIRNSFVFGFLLVFLLLTVVTYNFAQKRRINRILASQKQVIEAKMKEKSAMLRELHHRVKNNLQVIYSMLNIQSRQLKDPEAVEALKSSIYRIYAMALIHHKLYLDEKLTQVRMPGYLSDLTNNILESYSHSNGAIRIIYDVDDISLEADLAIPLGLIINELITNSIKHAFVGIAKPQLKIALKDNTNNSYTLIVEDNGIGLPEDLNHDNNGSFGMQLVNLLTQQLSGKLEVSNHHGTCFKITLQELKAV